MLLSAATQTPPPTPHPAVSDPALPAAAPALPPVRHEVVDPAQGAAIVWLSALLATGQADLYGQDEADLALLPTLTRTWMRKGAQLQLRAPGTNAKCSVSTAVDLADGGCCFAPTPAVVPTSLAPLWPPAPTVPPPGGASRCCW